MIMKVKEIITRNPEIISPDATLCEASRTMRDGDIGMLPVCDGDRLVGVLTDRDIAIRGVADGCDPLSTKVREIMTPGICWCFEDADLEEAAHLMEDKKIRRLAVLKENKRLVGIVSLGDFATRSNDDRLTEEVLEYVCQ
jgi:CBS domain-containing protein